MATWHTPASLRAVDGNGVPVWADAEQIDDTSLAELCSVAQMQVIAYAPALPADQPANTIPDNWRLGHRMQIQNLFAAAVVDNGGSIGDGEAFVVKPHPLDWHVKSVLRPKRGVPIVG